MTEVTGGFARSHANDTAAAVVSFPLAMAFTASRVRHARSLSKAARRSFHFSRRTPAGGGWFLTYLPERKPAARGDHGRTPRPNCLHTGMCSRSSSRAIRLYCI